MDKYIHTYVTGRIHADVYMYVCGGALLFLQFRSSQVVVGEPIRFTVAKGIVNGVKRYKFHSCSLLAGMISPGETRH